jgi:catechol 2,3-dioxygenase-like lactoylglutathione lyase family enzyme
MSQGVGVVGLYVRDQDEALNFYVEKVGFRVHTDARNGDYRWLTVQHPDQPSFQLGLFAPEQPMIDAATVQTLREVVAKGAMPGASSSRRSPWSASAAWTQAFAIPPATAGK